MEVGKRYMHLSAEERAVLQVGLSQRIIFLKRLDEGELRRINRALGDAELHELHEMVQGLLYLVQYFKNIRGVAH